MKFNYAMSYDIYAAVLFSRLIIKLCANILLDMLLPLLHS